MGASLHYRDSVPQHLRTEQDMAAFVKELMANNNEEFRAMKLVVLGNGRVGKTTLLCALKKLLDPNFNGVMRTYFMIFSH